MIQTLKNRYHLARSVIATVRYRFPSRSMNVIGVTGTDGKTTTVSLIYHILQSSGMKVGMLSTISATINGRSIDTGFHVTTPTPGLLQKILAQARSQKLTHFILEVTSHAIDQERVWGITYDIGVLTNVTREHLDYHKTYEAYLQKKLKLIERSRVGIVNKDDESYKAVQDQFDMKKIISYGIHADADVSPQTLRYKSSLTGAYNTYNILSAIAVAREVGVSDEKIVNALATFKTPVGRQNVVFDKEFRVVIDFAHTPNSLEEILKDMKGSTKGKVIHVFGSAGKRDAYKRADMGEVSSRYADRIILTAEDPRDESVGDISQAIAKGIRKPFVLVETFDSTTHEYMMITDRQQAIDHAVHTAQPGDTVLITGKGHEQSMNYGKGEESWSEFSAVENALKKRYGK